MKVIFKYRISGKVEAFEGEVVSEGKDYDTAMTTAYDRLCAEYHNPYLTITFEKVSID